MLRLRSRNAATLICCTCTLLIVLVQLKGTSFSLSASLGVVEEVEEYDESLYALETNEERIERERMHAKQRDLIKIIGEKTYIYSSFEHALQTKADIDLFDFTKNQTELIHKRLTQVDHRLSTADYSRSTVLKIGKYLIMPHRDSVEQIFKVEGRLRLLSVRTAQFLYMTERRSAQLRFVLYIEDHGHPNMQNAHFQGKMELPFISKIQVKVHGTLSPRKPSDQQRERDVFDCETQVHPLEHYIVYLCHAKHNGHALSFDSLLSKTHFIKSYANSAYFHVSVSGWTSFTLPLHAVPEFRPKYKLVQCVRALYGSLGSFCSHIHEFLAHGLTVSGIQHFIFYSRRAAVPACLQQYVDEGTVSLLYYPEMKSVAFRDAANENSYDQSLQMADCTMRHVDAELVLHADFDEYLSFANELAGDGMRALHQCSSIERLYEKIRCIHTYNLFSVLPDQVFGRLNGGLIGRFIFSSNESRVLTTSSALTGAPLALEGASMVQMQTQYKVLVRPGITWMLSPHTAWVRGDLRIAASDLANLVTLRHYRHHYHFCNKRTGMDGCTTDRSYEEFGLIIRQAALSSKLRVALSRYRQ